MDRAEHGPFWTDAPDLADRAAFYLRGIAQEHPFVEGNKRTAFEVVDTFLRLNGWCLVPSRDEATQYLLRVAGAGATEDDQVKIEDMAAWIRRHARTLK